MNGAVTVSPDEHGVVRVFSINLPPQEAKHWERDTGAVAAALGANTVDADRVELVDADTLRSVGLSTYLVDGMGLPEGAVAPDRSRLDALSGYVLIVRSGAFGSQGQTLHPNKLVTLIGTYREPKPMPSFEKLTSESAQGTLSGSGRSATGPASGRSRGTLGIVLATIAAVILIAIMAAVL